METQDQLVVLANNLYSEARTYRDTPEICDPLRIRADEIMKEFGPIDPPVIEVQEKIPTEETEEDELMQDLLASMRKTSEFNEPHIEQTKESSLGLLGRLKKYL